MPYYATGESRDAYITGVRPGGRYGALHDVEKRRDNLPDHVFNTIKEGMYREDGLRRIEEDQRARTRLEMFARPPKSKNGPASSNTAAPAKNSVAHLEKTAATQERHAALLELYAREQQEWTALLDARGLAAHRT